MHAQKIVASSGADEAGLEPYEIITHMDGIWVPDYDSFELVMESKSPGDAVEISVLSRENELGEREARRITVTLTNQLDYYLEQGIPSYFEDECEEEEDCLEKYTNELNELGIKDGDAFLGVHGFYSGTEAVDRYELSYSSGSFTRAMNFLFKPLVMMGTPIQLEGHTIPLDERNLLDAGDGLVTSIIGTEGLLAVFDFLFWFAWINFLLGFANLIPMVPFDGGQIARDSAHSVIRFFARDMNPLRVESLANRISGLSSIIMLIIILLPILVANILN
jgi:hypothetical protein